MLGSQSTGHHFADLCTAARLGEDDAQTLALGFTPQVEHPTERDPANDKFNLQTQIEDERVSQLLRDKPEVKRRLSFYYLAGRFVFDESIHIDR